MSAYIHTTTLQYPIYAGDIKLRCPHISFPVNGFQPPEEYQPVEFVAMPEYDPVTQAIVELPPECVGGTWRKKWLVQDLSPDVVAANQVQTAIATRNEAKLVRQRSVDAIKVTANGKVFDGDEISQGRMARAIIGLQAAGLPTIEWVLADNTVTQATVAELTEAMILAGRAQGAVWIINE